eukprot:TRINITY_DN21458_c0_g1_i1.p1 TRINITY_DN21458_c0_g1~~TRINITY_DN21458_c0_g1_i1.p1  ORF type:complete len:299 (+),score=93.46 TRINITY_DN21458_c0_g1_i1:240-1136(+)
MPDGDDVAVGQNMFAVKLHPLVVLNVSDHFTRATVNKNSPQRVVGALLGVQTGRAIEIFTSFELVVTTAEDGSASDLDVVYLEEKKAHYNAVFPTYELVGWYASGTRLHESDTVIHKAFMRYNEYPLVMQMDTQPPPDTTSLPVNIFESVVQVVNDEPKYHFSKIPYTIESEESERISVDNVAHGTGNNSVATPLRIYRDALATLQSRVRLVKVYLEGVRSGKHPVDHAMLREVTSLCNQLPLEMSEPFQKAFSNEYGDTMMVAYLGTLTRTCFALKQLVEQHNAVFGKRSGRRSPWY